MRSSIQLLKDSVSKVRSNLMLFYGITIIPTIFAYITTFFAPVTRGGEVVQPADPLYPAMMLVMIIMSIAMSAALILALNNSTLSATQAYKDGFPHFFKYLVLSLLIGLIVMVGLVLLVVPGIIFMVWFSLAAYVLLLENSSIIDSLKKSREYVRGRWWPVFGKILMMILFSILAGFALGLIAGIVVGILGIQNASNLIGQLVSFVVTPVCMAYIYFMYQDLKGGRVEEAGSTLS